MNRMARGIGDAGNSANLRTLLGATSEQLTPSVQYVADSPADLDSYASSGLMRGHTPWPLPVGDTLFV